MQTGLDCLPPAGCCSYTPNIIEAAVPIDLPLQSATTTLLESTESGNPGALDRLVAFLYDELRQMAHRQLAREHQAPTLHTTELVHEAYLRLVDSEQVSERGRAYFFGAAAQAMRRVLVDAARRRKSAKRGGGEAAVTLDESATLPVDAYASDLLDLNGALEVLEQERPRLARVVELRFFGGLAVAEAAEVLEVSPRTVKSDWALARAWLYTHLQGSNAGAVFDQRQS
jgi:RNA polymerase sigma-70 factor, ECF subfamily